ncbi:MAG: ABC transporter ATP-binding protein, partial [Cytophagaceae bacterium]
LEGQGKVRDYPGNYTDYREWRDAQPKKNTITKESASASHKLAPVDLSADKSVAPAQKKKLSFKEQREYETLESEIETLEQRKAEVIDALNGGGHHEQLTAWAKEIEEIEAQVAAKSDRWLELAEHM